MQLTGFMVCLENTEVETPTGDITQLFASPRPAMRVPRVPFTASFSVYLSVIGFDPDTVTILELQMQDPSGKVIRKLQPAELPPPEIEMLEQGLPSDQHTAALLFEYTRVRFRQEGLYTFVVLGDEQQIASIPYPIFRESKAR